MMGLDVRRDTRPASIQKPALKAGRCLRMRAGLGDIVDRKPERRSDLFERIDFTFARAGLDLG